MSISAPTIGISNVMKMVNKDVSEGVYTKSGSNFKLLSVGVKRLSEDFRLDLPLSRAFSKKCEKCAFSKLSRFRLLTQQFCNL